MGDKSYTEERPWSEVCCLEPVDLKEPLRSERHIRLLLLHPHYAEEAIDGDLRESEDPPLYCDVFQASLEDLKPTDRAAFAALSYRWGNPEQTKLVYCGQTPVKIHQNLYASLKEAILKDRPRLIWSDGLCINQDDAAEKSGQVARMSHVYRNAHVVIFLGYCTDPHAGAKIIEYLSLFSRVHTAFQAKTVFDNIAHVKLADLKRKIATEAKKSGLDRLQDLPWLQIRSFFANPYFKRAWIVQEITWAWSHELIFDQWLIPLKCLVQSAEIIKRFEFMARPLLLDSSVDTDQLDDLISAPESVAVLFEGIASEYEDRIPMVVSTYSMRELVDTYSNRECSDPRDHIYAMASLFPPGIDYPIDYSSSVVEVLTDFALHCFRTYNDLGLLGSCGRKAFWRDPEALVADSDRSWTADLPSWCPDWAGPWRSARELIDSVRHESMVRRPAGDTQPSFTTISRITLGLKGLTVGTVSACSVPWTLYSKNVGRNSEELHSMQEFMLKLSGTIPIAQLWRLYLDVVLVPREQNGVDVCRALYPDSPDQCTYGDIIQDLGPVWLQIYAEKIYRRAGLERNKRRRQKELNMAAELLDIMCSRSRNTRLIVTDTGYVGSAPEGSQPGDEICVLYGGKTMYVVRPHDDGVYHTYIGEAYVSGLMEGEALDAGFKQRELLLR